MKEKIKIFYEKIDRWILPFLLASVSFSYFKDEHKYIGFFIILFVVYFLLKGEDQEEAEKENRLNSIESNIQELREKNSDH